jgi:putative flippase GtrA
MSQLALKLGSYLKRTSRLGDMFVTIIRTKRTFIKFLLVGVLNTFIGLGLMFLLKIGLNWPYWMATFIGNSAGAAVSFLLNRRYTFNSTVPVGKGLLKFTAVILICYLVSYSASKWIATLAVPIQTIIATDNLAIIIGTGMYTIMNYFGQKMFVFYS